MPKRWNEDDKGYRDRLEREAAERGKKKGFFQGREEFRGKLVDKDNEKNYAPVIIVGVIIAVCVATCGKSEAKEIRNNLPKKNNNEEKQTWVQRCEPSELSRGL